MDASAARAIRYGVLTSMLRIRQQLMRPGEWDDPGILPLDVLQRQIVTTGYVGDHLAARYAHEHTIRWCLRHPAKAQP